MAGLEGDALEDFLDANSRASIDLQGSELSRVAPDRGSPPEEEADTISGRETPEDRSDDGR